MKKPLKIGLVLPAIPGYSETFFRTKIAGLQAAGHHVYLFAARKGTSFELCPVIGLPSVFASPVLQIMDMGVAITRLCLQVPRRAYRFYRLERAVNRTMRETIENLYLNSTILRYNLDWLHFGFATMGLRRENVARAMQIRMAFSLRGYDIAIYPLKFPGCYNLLWERADKIHTISDDLLALAYRDGLPASTPVVKITPAIETSRFQRKQRWEEKLKQPLQILTVARLHWKKGLEYTLEALAKLKQAGIDFHYTLIGTGEDHERLVFAAHQLNILEKVFFAGKQPHEAVKAAMEAADLYIQYSISEGFCNAVLEAQAMGLLCIVSDAEGLPENVLHGQTGWVVPKRQPEALARQIREIFQLAPSDLEGYRQRAVDRVREEFDIQKQINQFIHFYEN